MRLLRWLIDKVKVGICIILILIYIISTLLAVLWYFLRAGVEKFTQSKFLFWFISIGFALIVLAILYVGVGIFFWRWMIERGVW